MTTIQDLQNEMQQLRNTLNAENYKETVAKMRSIDMQIADLRADQLLNGVNSKQKMLRELALQAWECEQPTEDITTNTGEFHKVKVKKYPKLAAMNYTYAAFENGVLLTVRINGEKFEMYEVGYNGDSQKTYTRPESFTEFLKLNRISPKDITAEQFAEIKQTIKEANDELKKQIEAYSKKMDAINAYSLDCWKLIGRKAEHVYFYSPNL